MSNKYGVRESLAVALTDRGMIRLDDITVAGGTQWVLHRPAKPELLYFLGPIGSLRAGPNFEHSVSLTNNMTHVKLRNEGARTLAARKEATSKQQKELA